MFKNTTTTGTLKEVTIFTRKNYEDSIGLIMAFTTKEHGLVTRTFNLPRKVTPKTQLGKSIKDMSLEVPPYLLSSHSLLAEEIERQAEGKSYLLKLEPTGKEKYPYNIVRILSANKQ